MTSLTIELPDGVDAERATKAVADALRASENDLKERRMVQEVLESDQALAQMQRTWGRTGRAPPIVRAQVYKKVCVSQEIQPFWRIAGDDPRRPVVMYGCKELCIRRYSLTYGGSDCANGWCEHVADRYLRYIKYTCFDRHEHMRNMSKLKRRLYERHYLTYHYKGPNLEGWGDYWLRGKYFGHSTHEQRAYIRRLYKICQKTENLESRLKLAMRAQRRRMNEA